MLAHTDGPLYFPHVAIVSLCSPCKFTFRKLISLESSPEQRIAAETPLFTLDLAENSLLVFNGDAYTSMRHAVEAVSSERISITLRHVRK